jgi:hypothetical protein
MQDGRAYLALCIFLGPLGCGLAFALLEVVVHLVVLINRGVERPRLFDGLLLSSRESGRLRCRRQELGRRRLGSRQRLVVLEERR